MTEPAELAPHPARAFGARHPLPASGERERAAWGGRAQRAKTGLASQLEEVPGIGPARRKALLKAFSKDIEAIRVASIEDLTAVPGITREIAENLKTFEQEIIEQVRKLDAENHKRVLEFIRSLGQPSVTEEEWLEKAHALRLELRARYGEGFVFNSLSVLDEAREERLNDLMGDG